MDNYEGKIKQFEEEVLEGYSDPGDLVRNALAQNFFAHIGQQPHNNLVATAGAFSHFAFYLQVQENKARALVSHLKRTLDFNTAKEMGKLTFSARDTNTTKLAAVYANNPELIEMETKLAEAEQRAVFYAKLPDSVLEMVNVIKYEIRRKELETTKGRF